MTLRKVDMMAAENSPIAPTVSAQPAKTDEEKAVVAQVVAKDSSGPFVKYTGPETGRGTLATISVKEWNRSGFAATHGHEWKLQNNWRLPVSAFTDQQLSHLLDVDQRFVLVDGSGEKVDR